MASMPPPPPSQPPARVTPRIAVRDLLAGFQEVILVHNDQEYRLRVTRSGKLILTK